MLNTKKIKCTIYTEDPKGIAVLSEEDALFLEHDPFLEDVNLRAKVRPIGFHTRAHCENMQKNIIGEIEFLSKEDDGKYIESKKVIPLRVIPTAYTKKEREEIRKKGKDTENKKLKKISKTFSEGLKTWQDWKPSFSKKDFEKSLKREADQLENSFSRHSLDKLNIFFKFSTDTLLLHLLASSIGLLYFKKMHKEIEDLKMKYTL